ncbi:MAG TPA: RagB/SusD family nutrient uptake outer membrane protein, partial [Flavitalea sp.]|nr:RagB/SusD family nutrient uptake outer membrane protein [Flavitalea sp.]
AFTPDVKLIETDKNRIEVAGIRVIKYPPDYAAYSGGNQKNQLQIFRYADVLLMIAEAKARSGDDAGALTMVNDLRTARGAAPMASLTLVNESNVNDPNTLLSERGREMYWESWRRQDLIRFGVYLKAWGLKEADPDSRNLLYPIAPDELLANPNLVQNPGY